MGQSKDIPQGYQDSPLGIIPKEWKIMCLEEIGEILSGLTYNPEDVLPAGVLVLRASNIQEGNLKLDDNVYVRVKSYNPVKEGDILICVRNGSRNLIGKSAMIPKEAAEMAFGAFMSTFRSEWNSYIFYLLQTDYYNRQVHLNLGATINSINGSDLRNFRFPFPPQKEQDEISKILNLWDKAIGFQTTLIEKLELRKKGLMQQLLTGKKRLLDYGSLWPKVKAGKIFKSVSVKGCGNKELLSVTQEKGVIPRNMLEGRVTMPTGERESFKLVDVGDFVISLRSFQGGIEYSAYQGIVSPAYTVLKSKCSINIEFYKQYFKSTDFISRLAIAVIGIRDGKQISFENFCVIKIPSPSLEEQQAIANILTLADQEIILARQKLDFFKTQKKGLMQQLLTGKKRVKLY